VLDGILSVNPGIDVSDLVLVNHVDKELLQPIFDNPRYSKIKYLHGDFIQAEVLQKASVETASRVMVLADFSAEYSMQEVDSRTVMTVLTIESLNRQIYVVAELLDPKFEKFLKLANCDEIILSREYSKLIIANASSASGVSHVIGDLLSTEDGQGLRSRDIPAEYFGKSFGDLFDHLNQRFGDIAIGLLENTGNFYQRKREALSEAQMTPDISRLVENLKSVKQLIPNHSVLNPGRDYPVKSHSRAIVVEARFHETAEA
jgi:voltage-gated potassium channel